MVLKVTRAKSNNAHVNKFAYAFDPTNIDSAAEDSMRSAFFQKQRPSEGLLPGVLVPAAVFAILLGMTKVQWYDSILVPLYNGGSYSSVITKSWVTSATGSLLFSGALYVSKYGIEQMVWLFSR